MHAKKSSLFWLASGMMGGVALMLLAGCAQQDDSKKRADEQPRPNAQPKKALARVHGLTDAPIRGSVVFLEVADGVKITADVEGLKPGAHGFHVHEFGACSAQGAAAGAHFNPTHSKHGGPDSAERHVGDLGNLIADEHGYAHYERVDQLIKLSGAHSVVGRSIIIHADPDDLVTQPTGASGDRIACGVIEIEGAAE